MMEGGEGAHSAYQEQACELDSVSHLFEDYTASTLQRTSIVDTYIARARSVSS